MCMRGTAQDQQIMTSIASKYVGNASTMSEFATLAAYTKGPELSCTSSCATCNSSHNTVGRCCEMKQRGQATLQYPAPLYTCLNAPPLRRRAPLASTWATNATFYMQGAGPDLAAACCRTGLACALKPLCHGRFAPCSKGPARDSTLGQRTFTYSPGSTGGGSRYSGDRWNRMRARLK